MKGIELSQKFYEEHGKNMLHKDFGQYMNRIAVGIVGQGSECFGYDDDISKDHDYEAGFCIWITSEDEREFGFKLMRAYAKLPKEYMGVKIQGHSYYGIGKYGVSIIGDFYENLIGSKDVPDSWQQWLYTPEYALANSVNGKVFYDGLGEFTRIRNGLKNGMPEDVWKKKIAGRLAIMAQSGQYNYTRCIKHNEYASAQMAINIFVENTVGLIFALNRRYMPYYKWCFRAMRDLKIFNNMEKDLSYLLMSGNTKDEISLKENIIEKIASDVIIELKRQELTKSEDNYLEVQSFNVMDTIKDRNIHSLHIMEGM